MRIAEITSGGGKDEEKFDTIHSFNNILVLDRITSFTGYWYNILCVIRINPLSIKMHLSGTDRF